MIKVRGMMSGFSKFLLGFLKIMILLGLMVYPFIFALGGGQLSFVETLLFYGLRIGAVISLFIVFYVPNVKRLWIFIMLVFIISSLMYGHYNPRVRRFFDEESCRDIDMEWNEESGLCVAQEKDR